MHKQVPAVKIMHDVLRKYPNKNKINSCSINCHISALRVRQ
jgi:hypothetical protein